MLPNQVQQQVHVYGLPDVSSFPPVLNFPMMKFHDFIMGILCVGIAQTLSCSKAISKRVSKQPHTMQQETINKLKIRDFYRRAVGQGDIAFADELLADEYLQHSTSVKAGKAGLLEALHYMKQMPKPATTIPPFLRLIAEGDYVVTNLSFEWGGSQKIVVDIFRFENGKVAEHWDAVQDQPATTLNGHAMMGGPPPTEDQSSVEENKKIVEKCYKQVFINREVDALPDFVAADLIQHTPEITNGLAALTDYLSQNPDEVAIETVHRTIADGDFVVVQSTGRVSQKPTMFYDIFRLSEKKIVEQWRVKQFLP